MTASEVASWLYDIQDKITTLTRQLIGVAGYEGILPNDLRSELRDLSQKLIELNMRILRILIGLEQEA